jgi:hypothetical protein
VLGFAEIPVFVEAGDGTVLLGEPIGMTLPNPCDPA